MRSHGYKHMVAVGMILAVVTQGVLSLKLRDVSVPAVVIKGDDVWLNCTYDLEKETLYSIKWHKNNIEFYRYIPVNSPPGQVYDLEGIHIDLTRSSEGNIYMPTTDVNSEGIYRCEVSSEAPIFGTVKGERELRIYVNPSTKPQILGTKPHYDISDIVNLTCKSAPSRPAAFLKWLVNGVEVEPRSHQLYRPPALEYPPGLFTSTLMLSLPAPYHGKMSVQCEAIISQAHTLRSEEITITNSTRGRNSMAGDIDSMTDGPSISGGKSEYQVGETVDVNCTATKSQPPAELHWYINDKEVRPEHIVPRPPIVYSGGEESTVLGLRFEVRSRHFQKNEMRLRCTATLSEVKKMTSEPIEVETAEQQRSDLHVDQVNAESVQSKSSTSCLTTTLIKSFLCILILWSSV
ncbi:hypothetical protein JTE90_011240 [Oedothorax gibbosus]|uniref:Ig-like domain-containing protein n=1 Tax=Oedothorax gibbosus TaxID=931172 RepID=A0AAV6VXW7_9ARAC|nr:hypothetical protein JTE90_011240 [Oedothorax gibbosus]